MASLTSSFVCIYILYYFVSRLVLCCWLRFICSCTDILIQFFKGLNITADQKKVLRKACYSFYDAAAELLQSEHSVRVSAFVDTQTLIYILSSPLFGSLNSIKSCTPIVCPLWLLINFVSWQSLRLMEHENSKILNAKGELSDENIASYEKLRKSYDHLYRNISSWVVLFTFDYFITCLLNLFLVYIGLIYSWNTMNPSLMFTCVAAHAYIDPLLACMYMLKGLI